MAVCSVLALPQFCFYEGTCGSDRYWETRRMHFRNTHIPSPLYKEILTQNLCFRFMFFGMFRLVSCQIVPTFRRSLVPSSFGSKCPRINLFFYCVVLRGEATPVIRTVGKCYHTTRCNMPKYLKLQQHHCANCKSSKIFAYWNGDVICVKNGVWEVCQRCRWNCLLNSEYNRSAERNVSLKAVESSLNVPLKETFRIYCLNDTTNATRYLLCKEMWQ